MDGGLPQLRVLHMAGYTHVDPSVFEELSQTLETLEFSGVWAVTDACLAVYVDIEPSEAQAKLARLAEAERWARSKVSAKDLGTVPAVLFLSQRSRSRTGSYAPRTVLPTSDRAQTSQPLGLSTCFGFGDGCARACCIRPGSLAACWDRSGHGFCWIG